MSRRNKIIIAIVIALLIIFGFVLFFRKNVAEYFASVNVPEVINTTKNGGLINTTTSTNTNAPEIPTPPPPKADARNNLRRIAAAFAERFGSFSNQSNYENIIDLKVYMTDSLIKWADGYIADAQKKPGTAEYAGTTTRAIKSDVTEFDETKGAAKVVVKTQRQPSTSAGAQAVYYQDFILDFVKDGDIWKVDNVKWGPK